MNNPHVPLRLARATDGPFTDSTPDLVFQARVNKESDSLHNEPVPTVQRAGLPRR